MSKASRLNGKIAVSEGYVPSLRELASRLNISGSTAKNLRRDGLRVHRHGYHVEEARRLLNVRAMRARNIAASPDALKLKTEKLELDVQKARFELEVSKGEWVRKVDVSREWRRSVVSVKNALLGLGRQLAPLLHGRGMGEMKSIIDQKVFEVLRHLANHEHCPAELVQTDVIKPQYQPTIKEEKHVEFS
jgi:hypothetical protein